MENDQFIKIDSDNRAVQRMDDILDKINSVSADQDYDGWRTLLERLRMELSPYIVNLKDFKKVESNIINLRNKVDKKQEDKNDGIKNNQQDPVTIGKLISALIEFEERLRELKLRCFK